MFRTFPDINPEARRTYSRDDLVVQEWTATATHGNPVVYNDLMPEPTGRVICWNGADIMPVMDGRVMRKDVCSETLSCLSQPGAPL